MPTTEFQFDPTGVNPNNLISDEIHTLTEGSFDDYKFIIPEFSPFFTTNLSIVYKDLNGVSSFLVEGPDYTLGLPYYGAVRAIGIPVYGAIVFNNTLINGTISITYQTIGGDWVNDSAQLYTNLAQIGYSPIVAYYEQISNLPSSFPPLSHDQKLNSLMGQDDLIAAINNLANTIAEKQIALENQMNALQGLLEIYIDNKINNVLISFLNNTLNTNT